MIRIIANSANKVNRCISQKVTYTAYIKNVFKMKIYIYYVIFLDLYIILWCNILKNGPPFVTKEGALDRNSIWMDLKKLCVTDFILPIYP